MQVFLTTCINAPPIRKAMFNLCETFWNQQADVEMETILGHGRMFQRQRRILSELRSAGKFYIVADDDCLPASFQVKRLLQVAEKYPEFGILSFYPMNATINSWTPDPAEAIGGFAYEDSDVMEHVSVGGVRLVRSRIHADWPEMNEHNGYDFIQCSYLRSKGFRCGYLKNFVMNHIGELHSTVWPI
jgi:hypothetical protein